MTKPCDDYRTTCADYPTCVCGRAWREREASEPHLPNDTTVRTVALCIGRDTHILMLDASVIDFDVGEPCRCAFCYARSNGNVKYRKPIPAAYRHARHGQY